VLSTYRKLLIGGFLAGFCYMGGESESSSDQTANQQDRRVSGRDGANVSGDSNTVLVQATDHGAVLAGAEATRGAFAFADSSSRTFAALALGAFGAAAESERHSMDAIESVYDKALAGSRSMFGTAVASVGTAFETAKAGDQRIVSIVGLAVVGLAGAALLFGKAR
jgi:hypothetical protein